MSAIKTTDDRETRERILEAACHEFSRNGYGGTKMRLIADRADLEEILGKDGSNELFVLVAEDSGGPDSELLPAECVLGGGGEQERGSESQDPVSRRGGGTGSGRMLSPSPPGLS